MKKIWVHLTVCRSKGKHRPLPAVPLPGTISSKNLTCPCPTEQASHKPALLRPEEQSGREEA